MLQTSQKLKLISHTHLSKSKITGLVHLAKSAFSPARFFDSVTIISMMESIGGGVDDIAFTVIG